MNQEEHEKISMQLFGERFPEVHAFMDRYYPEFRSRNHRRLLHHRLGVELCVKLLGERARKAAEQHILDDLKWIPTTWADYDEDYRLYTPLGTEDERQEEILVELYGEELYQQLHTP